MDAYWVMLHYASTFYLNSESKGLLKAFLFALVRSKHFSNTYRAASLAVFALSKKHLLVAASNVRHGFFVIDDSKLNLMGLGLLVRQSDKIDKSQK